MGVGKPLKTLAKLNGKLGVVLGWSTHKKSYLVQITADADRDASNQNKKKRKKKKTKPRASKIPLKSLEWNGMLSNREGDRQFDWRQYKPAENTALYDKNTAEAIHESGTKMMVA